MKRILFLSGCFFALTCVCFAQDVIVTKGGTKISASMIRIDGNNIFFKYFDNPQGSTFSIGKNDASRIFYQNGRVEPFDTNTQTTAPVRSQSQQRQPQTTDAPDIITMRSGNKINAIVREITPTQVLFYLSTEPGGELYYVNKSNVSTILYKDGRTESFAVEYTKTPVNRQRTAQQAAHRFLNLF